jgi:hypothetical protein
MATSTNAFFLLRGLGAKAGGTGLIPVADGIFAPEVEPAVIWGQGTPAGTLAPWTLVNKGSLYAQVDATDDQSHLWMKVDEGNDAADWVRLLTSAYNVAQTYVDTELHAVEINQTATHISGGNMVALNVAQTTAGSAGSWSAAIYAKVTQGATKNVNGYLTAAEFELVNSNTNVSDWFVATLNANSTNLGSHSSFIALRNYGTAVLNSLFWVGDSALVDATGADATVLVSQLSGGKETTCDSAVRFIVGGTPYWFLCSKTAPA